MFPFIHMAVNFVVVTGIRPNPYLFQGTTKKSCGVGRPFLSWRVFEG